MTAVRKIVAGLFVELVLPARHQRAGAHRRLSERRSEVRRLLHLHRGRPAAGQPPDHGTCRTTAICRSLPSSPAPAAPSPTVNRSHALGGHACAFANGVTEAHYTPQPRRP